MGVEDESLVPVVNLLAPSLVIKRQSSPFGAAPIYKHPDIINLYCVWRDFHTTTTKYLQNSTRQWVDFMAAGVMDQVSAVPLLCQTDPAGRKYEDTASDSLTVGFIDRGLDHSQIYSPTFCWQLREEMWKTVLPALIEGHWNEFKGFNRAFCTDADSNLGKGCLRLLMEALARDKNAIAAAGTVFAQLEPGFGWSSWDLHQRFQYTFSQFVRRRAEGHIGKVTCLPGCVTMIAVRKEMAGAIQKTWHVRPIHFPALIIVPLHHSSPPPQRVTSTNASSSQQGTDRRVTYSMLSQGHNLSTFFVPKAVSEAVAPQPLERYLSQRQRWGSNSYFNGYFYLGGENMSLIIRVAAASDTARQTFVYCRVLNTIFFISSLVWSRREPDILLALIAGQLPLACLGCVRRHCRVNAADSSEPEFESEDGGKKRSQSAESTDDTRPVNAETSAEEVGVCFLSKQDYPPQGKGRESLLAHFGVPEFVASRTCFELNGFFGHRVAYDGGDRRTGPVDGWTGHVDGDGVPVTSCTTWFRCLFKMIQKIPTGASEDGLEYCSTGKGYQWYETTVFSHWKSEARCQVLCVDVPFDFAEELKKALESRTAPLNFGDPFAMHVDVWDRIVVYYDISVWRVRDPVRMLEKDPTRRRDVFRPTHDHMRHAIHVSEILESAVSTAMEMQRCRAEIYKDLPRDLLGKTYEQQANEYAAFQVSVVRNLKLRSESNQARLGQEINYAFNNLALQDNNFIKSITLFTMIFLPATFISGVFSTTFFSYGQRQWEVSDQLWIYWAIIIPVTIAVILLWHLWLYKRDAILKLLQKIGAWCRNVPRKPAKHLMKRWERRGGSKDAEAGLS
ncbi:hypothetical protein DL766_007592 [Monosporascus sp. MC13-8B]|nr:hypothetical protein DL763_011572 [Monosporascus cannonballus]RYP22972.1 hypothetical protein DL766_007592 [Monosporascus sp. MC13-8B]